MASKTRGHIKGLMHRIFDSAMLWEHLPADRNPMSLVRIEGSSKRRKKPRILTPEEFSILEYLWRRIWRREWDSIRPEYRSFSRINYLAVKSISSSNFQD